MNPKAKQRALAPVRPYIVLRLNWRAIDRLDPSIEVSAWSWMGWMSSPPEDWNGALDALAACAPEGALAEVSANHGSGEQKPLLLFPMKPSGQGAPWIDSEQSAHLDAASPRVMVLSVCWIFQACDIPREWSEPWHEAMGELALGAALQKVQGALERHGFADLEFMGRFKELDGEHYWCNVSEARYLGWSARREARGLDLASAPGGLSKSSKAL